LLTSKTPNLVEQNDSSPDIIADITTMKNLASVIELTPIFSGLEILVNSIISQK
jgi:hypothetical protein